MSVYGGLTEPQYPTTLMLIPEKVTNLIDTVQNTTQ